MIRQDMVPESSKPWHLPAARRTSTRAKVAITLVIALSLILAGATLLRFSDRSSSLPDSVKNRVEFTAFVPVDLPSGYSIDESSYSFAEEALIFKVNAPIP